MKNQIDIIPGLCMAVYQKMTCKTTKTTATHPAQKMGRLVSDNPLSDDRGNDMLDEVDQLVVRRWADNELHAPNKGMWRRRTKGEDLQIKGALLRADLGEEVLTHKKDRSNQLFKFGYS